MDTFLAFEAAGAEASISVDRARLRLPDPT